MSLNRESHTVLKFFCFCRACRAALKGEGSQMLHLLLIVVLTGFGSFIALDANGQGRAMEVEDIMNFNQIKTPDISESGGLISFEQVPDRGDGAAVVVDDVGNERIRIPRGTDPRLNSDEGWFKAWVHDPFRQRLKTEEGPDSLVAIQPDLSDSILVGNVKKTQFSQDGQWMAVLTQPENPEEPGTRTGPGGSLRLFYLRDLSDMPEPSDTNNSSSNSKIYDPSGRLMFQTDNVHDFAIDSLSTQVVYSVADSTGAENGLFRVDLLDESLSLRAIHRHRYGVYDGFSWHEPSSTLAFLFSREDELGNPSPAELKVWDGDAEQLNTIAASDDFSGEHVLPLHSKLSWSNDGDRLFFGWQPLSMYQHSLYEEEEELYAVTDRDSILAGADVAVWHGDDPLIKPHEEQTWEQRRDHTYLTVYHFSYNRIVELADEQVPYVEAVDNSRYALGRNPRPYKKEITWDGRYNDYYVINLRDGSRTMIIDRLRSTTISLSPGGRFVLFYEAGHWHMYDIDRNIIRNITKSLDVPFADEDHDYPFPARGYGMAGWVAGDRAVVIYDKYDIWQIDTRSLEWWNLTAGQGRQNQRQFRVVASDPEHEAFQRNEHLLARGFGERDKTYGLYGVRISREGYERLVEGPHRYQYLGQASENDRILYTRESYSEFPDLWVSDRRLRNSRKVTLVNPQIDNFAWGRAELVRWLDLDGEQLDGVLITPDDYVEEEPLPVLVYFYEQFSQRLHHFNEQVINHRPGFPYYVSNGYAVFLPDVRYDVGIPGYSATRSVVPGVQKLIDMGVADPDAIALHGHSWSGYQAAHMATETHLFAAVIAGAPVSNMTSAYGGIRWGTGLARQFQYEQTQSRIGGTLWDSRDKYIENSPVFYADRIQTPMMIMFGDEDGAVPWEQGIELYLAMRRLHKDVIFLQYRGEPHHPQKYANKLDYYLRMKEYLDHHLKGKPAPAWIRQGSPFTGQ